MANRGWKYKKPKRQDEHFLLYFTPQDEIVNRSNYVRLHTILTKKEYGICLTERECREIREKSYKNLLAIYQKYNSPRFDDLWNYNIKAITECGLNEFFRIKQLRPFANVIHCIQKQKTIMIGGNFATREIIGFGIRRDYINDYKTNVEQAKRLGVKFEYPFTKPKKNLTKEQVVFGDKTVKIDEFGQVSIARNALYNRFSHWCDLEGVTVEQGVLMAIKGLLKDYPNKQLGSLEAYQVVTELDRKIFKKADEMSRVEERLILSEMIRDEAENIIYMYNTDVQNIGKPRLDMNTYVNNALHFMNNKMPMKYRNQELYDELVETEKMEAENESLIQEIKREEKRLNGQNS